MNSTLEVVFKKSLTAESKIYKLFPTFDSVKDTRLAEREEFSDVEDSEDEDSDFADFTVPVKARKRKIASSDRKVKKPGLRIPKKSSRSDGRKSLPARPCGDHESRKCRK